MFAQIPGAIAQRCPSDLGDSQKLHFEKSPRI